MFPLSNKECDLNVLQIFCQIFLRFKSNVPLKILVLSNTSWQHDFEDKSSATMTVTGVCHYLILPYGIELNVIPLDNKSSKLWI